MSNTKIRFRKKKSKFDPYINEITELAQSGATTTEIADAIGLYCLDDIVLPNSLYCFMRTNNITSQVTQGCKDKSRYIPKCEGCEQCLVVDRDEKRKIRICMAEKKVIKGCATSPMYCPKRKLTIK